MLLLRQWCHSDRTHFYNFSFKSSCLHVHTQRTSWNTTVCPRQCYFWTEKIECTHMALVFGHFLPHRVTSRHLGCFSTAPHLPPLRLRDTVAYRASERELPVEQSQYSEIQRRICHVAKCLYMRARALIIIAIYNALIIIAIYNARVSASTVKWQDKDRFDSCCTRNQPQHSIIVFIASQIPYNEIHFLTTSICTVIAA